MASFFRGITQPTPLQQAIEKATDGNQPDEDWGLIMKICDHVGLQEESAKEAIKVIRKRLQTTPLTSAWRTIGLTVTLLEALSKNCGKIFHLQLAQKDFLKELGGLVAPKNNPPPAIQEKVLGLIQTWTLAFRNDPDLKNVEQFYQECIQQGLEFPPAEPESTIKAAVPPTGTMERPTQYVQAMSQPEGGAISRANQLPSDGSSQQVVIKQMTPEQIAKLRSELDVVQTNVQVFGEILITLQPGEEHPEDFDFLNELHKTCRQMQARIVDLLTQISIDEITMDLLRYNDEFNHSFKTFESYMQERERRVGPAPIPINDRTASPTLQNTITTSQSPTKSLPSPRNQENEPALIKFDEEPIVLSTNLRNTHIQPSASDAAAKPPVQQSTASVTTRSTANNHDPENDVKEVEQWLNEGEPKSGTADPFNDFLEKRASTIPAEPISEQEIHINLEDQSKNSNA